MAFTVEDFEDLQRLLAEHPEWRAQLRPLILGDEFMELPAGLRGTNDRLERIEASLEELASQVRELVEATGLLAVRKVQTADPADLF